MTESASSQSPSGMPEKKDERRAFLLLAVFLAPALAVAIVGGWGFIVWMFQIINGPPTG